MIELKFFVRFFNLIAKFLKFLIKKDKKVRFMGY